MSPLDDLSPIAACCPALTARADIEPYARDWSGRYAHPPHAVLRPGSTAEVAAALRACAAAGFAVVPAGGRTGLCGGAVPRADGPPAVVLSLERMNRIRAVDARDFTITVDAGCTVRAVQEAAAAVDRLFPLSFGAEGTAQIGGALSTNAGGIRTIRWGNARDLVLGLEVVLPDGRVLDDLRRVRKDNTGYALRHLFIGAEGTLGVITGAALKLAPALRARETAFLAVPSPAAALALLDRLASNGAELIGFELIGRWPLELVRRHAPRARLPFALESPWYVLLELGTAAAADLRTPLEAALAAAIEAGEAGEAVIAESEEQRAALWYLREIMPECNRAEAPSVSADTSVPVSAVPAFLAEVEAALAARWPEGKLIAVGHAGDGNVHIALQAPRGTPREAWHRNAEAIEDMVNRIAVAHGGSFSAEHGIGQSKRHAMAALRDPVALDLMRTIKAALDPRGLMNPGKMLP
ncbi:FAD-binding oxidoreductase [Caldovatus aquaticus]|uniref:FAD-binding oxidoreductase n=1 Tax=Caldovatus aquaticus TaxID=2865671 RepID=A0ABS7EYN7_9PROT|nr:FAD-binding oxidoreductase [Caldovatus aquaticus]MBW8268464.1 FAD-binding oxidoreductase [Caldovatus aquaticus]